MERSKVVLMGMGPYRSICLLEMLVKDTKATTSLKDFVEEGGFSFKNQYDLRKYVSWCR